MLFLSHTWQKDELMRDTHTRVLNVKEKLCLKGIKVWFDEEKMINNIDACMASGINDCSAVVVFITRNYCNKVERAAKYSDIYDNCFKEFTYATTMQKIIIPVVFEESMTNLSSWPSGIVRLHLASKMLIFAHEYTPEETANAIIEMYIRLKRLSGRENSISAPKKIPTRPAPILKICKDNCMSKKHVKYQLTSVKNQELYNTKRPILSWIWC